MRDLCATRRDRLELWPNPHRTLLSDGTGKRGQSGRPGGKPFRPKLSAHAAPLRRVRVHVRSDGLDALDLEVDLQVTLPVEIWWNPADGRPCGGIKLLREIKAGRAQVRLPQVRYRPP